jgi:hypothetical protein
VTLPSKEPAPLCTLHVTLDALISALTVNQLLLPSVPFVTSNVPFSVVTFTVFPVLNIKMSSPIKLFAEEYSPKLRSKPLAGRNWTLLVKWMLPFTLDKAIGGKVMSVPHKHPVDSLMNKLPSLPNHDPGVPGVRFNFPGQ